MTRVLLLVLPSLMIAGCSTGKPYSKAIVRRGEAIVAFETPNWSFEQVEIFSPDYDRKVPAPRVWDRKAKRVVIDFAKAHPAHEWTHAVENASGVVASLDHAIEGRAWEVPLLVRRQGTDDWLEIPFKKPHFSSEVSRIALEKSGLRIRLRMEPGTAPAEELTGSMKDSQGSPMDFADWSYSFQRGRWTKSSKALSFP